MSTFIQILTLATLLILPAPSMIARLPSIRLVIGKERSRCQAWKCAWKSTW